MNRLKQLRNEIGVSLRKLTKYTGICDPVLSYLENEQRPFRQTHINALSSFFNVTADFLLGRTDNGYIVRPEYGDEELILTESEYRRLTGFIHIDIISLDTKTTNLEVNTGKEIVDINIPSFVVYRELKGTVKDYDLQETLLNKYLELGKHCSTDELTKAIKFIEEYILNKR